MFRAKSKHGNGAGRRHVDTCLGGRKVEEDYDDAYEPPASDKPTKDPEYWRVTLPDGPDELDILMWGDGGAPPSRATPPVDSFPPKFDSGKGENSDDGVGGEECAGEADHGQVHANENVEGDESENDNILSALEISPDDKKDDAKEPPAPDKIILEDIVWKQRSGFGKYSLGIMQHEWVQRRVVLFESGMLRYYALKRDMEGVKFDPENATDPDKSPWAYDKQETRGEMFLRGDAEDEHSDEDGEEDGSLQRTRSSSFDQTPTKKGGMLRLHSLVSSNSANAGGVRVQARERKSNPGPTPFEIDITRKDNGVMWRFCFQSQPIQIEWLSALKGVSSHDGETSDDDSLDGAPEGLANHGFRPGDHIIRWEMLPVLYPIQIHGIVLEAGSNCVIIADFGLASYDNRSAGDGELNTFDEKDESHDIIMAAWEKIKPKTKRLNVSVVTDRREIRKWSKINYGDRAGKKKDEKGKKKPGFLASLLPWEQKGAKKVDEAKIDEAVSEDGEGMGEHGSRADGARSVDDDEEGTSAAEENGSPVKQIEVTDDRANNDHADHFEKSTIVEGEPEWFHPGYRGSSSSVTSDGQSVFSVDHRANSNSELPKSDSSKLVLARTHFILENEDLLPPYHVFYSNSECIAVWCKTGRWSTLQAAVYLVSSSVGFGKSAAMMTVSVAAAHLILVPALAVGGLAVVGAPLWYLKRSQDRWDAATMRLTDEFWRRAGPDVFVEAIEYWANWGGGKS